MDSSASPISRSWYFLMASDICCRVAQNFSLTLFATFSLMDFLIFSSSLTLSLHSIPVIPFLFSLNDLLIGLVIERSGTASLVPTTGLLLSISALARSTASLILFL